MIDDREVVLISAFRLHEVASRLAVLSRVAASPCLQKALREVSEQLAGHEQRIATLALSSAEGPCGEGAGPPSPSAPAPAGASPAAAGGSNSASVGPPLSGVDHS